MTPQAVDLVSKGSNLLAVMAQSNAANLGYHAVSKYPRADYICLTEGEIRLEARDRQIELKAAMESLARKLSAKHVSVTRGNKGCICYSSEEGFFEVPAFAGQVVDRVGAGDAFLSITSMCVASGVPAEVIGFIGNAVGAQAVAIVGNRTPVQRVALYKHIESVLK
jgi:sugar/nucleoside kinase (ribokinase family)